ncbi:BCCT family transporter [Wenzhouxiangella sp. XN79A]|nr:BCCT family transporter [Wenzhouxiangella sp. XN79A]
MQQDLSEQFGPFERMQPTVFFGSAMLVMLFVFIGGAFTEWAAGTFESVQGWVTATFGGYYMLLASALLVMALVLLITPAGRLRLGDPDSRPEFSYPAWFAMLFAAGMGTGLVFWGVAEPLSHYLEPPGADPESAAAAREGMTYAFLHWGLHPWAIYLVLALGIGYGHFRLGLPLAPRAVLWPLLGKRIYGPVGHAADILCTVGTLLGVATSLGLGAMQINAGLSRSLDVPTGTGVQVAIIGAITLVATISVVSGLQRGIRRLSGLNIALAAVLMVFVFAVGPTLPIIATFFQSLGSYLQRLPTMSLEVGLGAPSEWETNWTLFYWGWWISWSPFVGIFVARISKGRTVREVILAALIVPTLVTFGWMSTFGGAALDLQQSEGLALASQVIDDAAIALHLLLEQLPWASVSTVFATLVIIIFFITSSDSGSLVDDMVTSGGHPDPPVAQRLFWALSEGAVAATLLLVGGLSAIQQAAIAMALPMSLLLIAAAIGLLRVLWMDARVEGVPEAEDIAAPDE